MRAETYPQTLTGAGKAGSSPVLSTLQHHYSSEGMRHEISTSSVYRNVLLRRLLRGGVGKSDLCPLEKWNVVMKNGLLFNARAPGCEQHQLYYRSMGKIFRVVAIAVDDDAANHFLAAKDRESIGVIGVIGEMPVIAEFHGEKIVTKD